MLHRTLQTPVCRFVQRFAYALSLPCYACKIEYAQAYAAIDRTIRSQKWMHACVEHQQWRERKIKITNYTPMKMHACMHACMLHAVFQINKPGFAWPLTANCTTIGAGRFHSTTSCVVLPGEGYIWHKPAQARPAIWHPDANLLQGDFICAVFKNSIQQTIVGTLKTWDQGESDCQTLYVTTLPYYLQIHTHMCLALQMVSRQIAYLWHVVGEDIPQDAFKKCDFEEPLRSSDRWVTRSWLRSHMMASSHKQSVAFISPASRLVAVNIIAMNDLLTQSLLTVDFAQWLVVGALCPLHLGRGLSSKLWDRPQQLSWKKSKAVPTLARMISMTASNYTLKWLEQTAN